MIKNSILLFTIYLILLSCEEEKLKNKIDKKKSEKINTKSIELICNDSFCEVKYDGLEFINYNGEIIDTAHRMSNLISGEVGKKLKLLFDEKKYSKVDLNKIKMTSEGMDNVGDVKLEIFIPFKRVKKKCDAATAFDHSGGWDHAPEIEKRIKNLSEIAVCKKLEVSKLIKTPENFQEYWIQWKHETRQADCSCK